MPNWGSCCCASWQTLVDVCGMWVLGCDGCSGNDGVGCGGAGVFGIGLGSGGGSPTGGGGGGGAGVCGIGGGWRARSVRYAL